MSTSGQKPNLMEEALCKGLNFRRQFEDNNSIVRTVRLVGGAMITVLLITVVLNEVFAAVDVSSGAFSGIADDLQTTGIAALSLLVVGLIVVSANRIMGIFGGGGGM
jgi:hypothetical protein